MKQFIHHDFPILERIDTESIRYYKTPEGKHYPSVTAVTNLLNQKEIDKWKTRVGESTANEISSRSIRRGVAFHSLCEAYLKGEKVQPGMMEQNMFNSIIPYLNKLNNIHCLESQMYSDKLRVAGTVDCIAEYEGKLVVIDFKTASKPKTKNMISNYFMQATAYGIMFTERTGIPIHNIMIMMAEAETDTTIIFIDSMHNWVDQFMQLRKRFDQEGSGGFGDALEAG